MIVRNKEETMKRFMVICATILIIAVGGNAGYAEKAIKFNMEMVSVVNDRPSTPVERNITISGNKMLVEEHKGHSRSIYRFDLEKIWVLYQDKTYNELPLKDIGDVDATVAGAAIEKSKETQKISGFDCIKYVVSLGYKTGAKVSNEIWVASKFPYKIDKKFLGQINPQLRRWLSAIKDQIGDGFPIRYEMVVQTKQNIRITHTFKDFEQIEVDAGIFEIPKDFTKKEIQEPHEFFVPPEKQELEKEKKSDQPSSEPAKGK